MARCSICKKSATSGSNVSHAQNRTKRKFRPNLQKVNGVILCSKCIKTIKKINREEIAKIEEKKLEEISQPDADLKKGKTEKAPVKKKTATKK